MPLLLSSGSSSSEFVSRNILYKWLTRFFPSLKVGDLEIDEDLPNYFDNNRRQ